MHHLCLPSRIFLFLFRISLVATISTLPLYSFSHWLESSFWTGTATGCGLKRSHDSCQPVEHVVANVLELC
ncbi:hypothetical protein Y032_0011g1420 [Ancylostoma ceylanicum]|uniref:Secreted protein n=1 Tax=Ancylostoma ceylanicum TaxID=53326 RepID=A0A016VGG4_9BILA|nr:hypothetical protein Y032_0011g1420 [Ancylostoma ceylanicum]